MRVQKPNFQSKKRYVLAMTLVSIVFSHVRWSLKLRKHRVCTHIFRSYWKRQCHFDDIFASPSLPFWAQNAENGRRCACVCEWICWHSNDPMCPRRVSEADRIIFRRIYFFPFFFSLGSLMRSKRFQSATTATILSASLRKCFIFFARRIKIDSNVESNWPNRMRKIFSNFFLLLPFRFRRACYVVVRDILSPTEFSKPKRKKKERK